MKNSEHRSLFLFVLLSCTLALTSCGDAEPMRQQLVFSGPMMGTEYRVSVVYEGDIVAKEIETSIVKAMNDVNHSMSHYLPDSELNQFNRLPANKPYTPSADFLEVVKEALKVSDMSDGAFDITLAKAINVWGFGPGGKVTKQPTSEQLESLRKTIGYTKLSLAQNQFTKTVDGVELNLSAIAKGYAVDKVAKTLEDQGIDNYLVNIGGELRASGRSISGEIWKVGIEKPHILGGIQQIASLDNMAIATSGDYRNYLVIDGQQVSHTIDSKTLTPVFHKLALVSVINERASTADALATAMMAMGEERAWKFAKRHHLAVYLIIRGDDQQDYTIRSTEKFKAYLQ